MTFLDQIFASLEKSADAVVLQELREGAPITVTARQLLEQVEIARGYLRRLQLKKGDRCALLAQNSIRWVAMDLAIMAEGLTAVPLYTRQAPAELVAMMKDCGPAIVACGDQSLVDAVLKEWPEAGPCVLLDNVFKTASDTASGQAPVATGDDVVAIIYTSGTSGEAKGVMLNATNIGHMLACTSGRLDQLMKGRLPNARPKTNVSHPGLSNKDASNKDASHQVALHQDAVFHYLPFCFAGSWVLLLTCLLRGSLLSLNTDLGRISGDMRSDSPDYFLNVPALLERMRKAVDEQLWKTGGIALKIYSKAKGAWVRRQEGKSGAADGLWLGLANQLVFPTIRKKMIGERLRALICGSAPLSVETQLFFLMLGIPVLQVYGLTETTAICTMDDPEGKVVPGRTGPAIAGVEMKLAENEEIVVRGPNVFPGYWQRPDETAKVLRDGWFHTGDQGELNGDGNWKIVGRMKNLIILGSGHNIAPEPIENKILQQLPDAVQMVIIGNGRGFLTALITGKVPREKAQQALDLINHDLPHYKQVRALHFIEDPFTIDSGLLTANGKLKRDLIAQRFKYEIEAMYRESANSSSANQSSEIKGAEVRSSEDRAAKTA